VEIAGIIQDINAQEELRAVARQCQRELVSERGLGSEAQVLEAIQDLWIGDKGAQLSIKEISDRFTELHADEYEHKITPKWIGVRLSLDHDPLFQFQRWQANLRILGMEAVQTVPMVPWSHPFVERLIRSIREEYLDQLFYWNASDLQQKLEDYRSYYNAVRVHQGLGGDTPAEKVGASAGSIANLVHYGWQGHCHSLVQLPIAA
jgi:hypothetical protein